MKKPSIAATLPRMIGSPDEQPDRRMKLEATKQTITTPPSAEDVEQFEKYDLDTLMDRTNKIMQFVTKMLAHQTRGSASSPDFVKLWLNLRGVRDLIGEWDSAIGLILEATTELMVAQMEADHVSSVKLENGKGASFWLEAYASVMDPDALRTFIENTPQCAYCGITEQQINDTNRKHCSFTETGQHHIRNGNVELYQKLTVNWQVLNSYCKRRLEAGETEPPGVTVFAKPKIRKL